MNICLTADDVGAILSIDNAVRKLIRLGSINCLSIFANGIIDTSWIKLVDPKIKLGLHLTLSFGKPLVSGINNCLLDDNGHFLHPKKPISPNNENIENSLNDFIEKLDCCEESELMSELKAQYEFFSYKYCRTPDFLNLHHDLDKSPLLQRVLVSAFPDEPTRKLREINELGYSYIYSFLNMDDSIEISEQIIFNLLEKCITTKNDNLNKNFEIVFHPGFDSCQLRRFSTYSKMREREYRILCSERIVDLLSGAFEK
jgi:hypothetical protein